MFTSQYNSLILNYDCEKNKILILEIYSKIFTYNEVLDYTTNLENK